MFPTDLKLDESVCFLEPHFESYAFQSYLLQSVEVYQAVETVQSPVGVGHLFSSRYKTNSPEILEAFQDSLVSEGAGACRRPECQNSWGLSALSEDLWAQVFKASQLTFAWQQVRKHLDTRTGVTKGKLGCSSAFM